MVLAIWIRKVERRMAKIIFGVAGEGFGHCSRTELIGRRLIEAGHTVIFATSGRSLCYLRPRFGEAVNEIFGLSLAFEGWVLSPVKTVLRNLRRWPKGRALNRWLYRNVFEPSGADLVISDYEPFTALWAWRNGVPCVTVGHEHMTALSQIDWDSADRLGALMARTVTAAHGPKADAHIILNFFETPMRKCNAILAPPVVGTDLLGLQSSRGRYIQVYTSDASARARYLLLDVLRQFAGHQFVVYGFDESRQTGNCVFKRYSRSGFLADLAGCRAVIATAGFALISECLHFRKPMLLVPIFRQFEQMVNAEYIQRLGAGRAVSRIDYESLDAFLRSLDEWTVPSEGILYPDKERFFVILEQTLGRIIPGLRLGDPDSILAGALQRQSHDIEIRDMRPNADVRPRPHYGGVPNENRY